MLWQKILVTRDEALYEQAWQQGRRYPEQLPQQFEEWTVLVNEFLIGLTQALDWTASPERLALEVDSGITMADVLRGLAVHNAYHFGKIVALRQMMDTWKT